MDRKRRLSGTGRGGWRRWCCSALVVVVSSVGCMSVDEYASFPREPRPPASYSASSATSAVRLRVVPLEGSPSKVTVVVDDRLTCFAPCVAWVPPSSDVRVRVDDSRRSAALDLSQVPGGAAVRARVRSTGTFGVGVALAAAGGVFLLVAGGGYASGRGGRWGDGSSTPDPRVVALAIGVVLAASGFALTTSPDVEASLRPDPMPLRRGGMAADGQDLGWGTVRSRLARRDSSWGREGVPCDGAWSFAPP